MKTIDSFSQYKSYVIAIYGLGENARLLVENNCKLHFCCLVANDHIGEEKYGLTIRSIDDAVKEADVILIAASFSATSIIYNRIKDVVPEGMPILNMLGENLAITNKSENNPYWAKSFDDLLSVIKDHDVISFDIFDTLIMRDLLDSSDVLAITGETVKDPSLPDDRKRIEKEIRNESHEPKLFDIYTRFVGNRTAYSYNSDELKQVELSVEENHILPRRRMIDALKYAISSGKKVFLTSDMYMDESELSKLLNNCGVDGDFEIIDSCEYDVSKFTGELFDVLTDKAANSNILHIGDDELVDQTRAEEKGIDSYLIASSYRMLAMSNSSFVFDSIKTFDDKCYLGKLVSEMLNDPFALNGLAGKITLSSYKDIAMLMFPITKLFFDHIISLSENYDCLLFPSRDGFYLFNLYCKYRNDNHNKNLPPAKYIYSSRMSLSRAALKDNDTFDVLIHKLFGNQSKNVKKYVDDLFGVDIPEDFNGAYGSLLEKYGQDNLLNSLHECIPDIVTGLAEVSQCYKDYLGSLDLMKYEKLALIDIVSYGTQPYCLSKILGRKVDMISIGSTGVPNVFMDADSVYSIYGNVNEEVNGSLITKSDLSVLHLLMEVLYSSKDGQFLSIDDSGTPEFLTGSEYNSKLLDGVQSELTAIFDSFISAGNAPIEFSPEFCHGVLRIMRSSNSNIDEKLREQFIFSDPYDGGFVTVNLADSL